MQLPRPLDYDAWSQVLAPLNIETYGAAFATPDHTPLFLIDAEQEPTADLAFLRDFSRRVSPPFTYWTVPQTDHYLDTGFILGLPCYNVATVRLFVDRVVNWLG
jgi:hypothetical protein